jgi:hypothetical protein
LQQNGAVIVNSTSYDKSDGTEGEGVDFNSSSSFFSTGGSENHSPHRKEKPGNVPISPKPFSTTHKDSYKPPVSVICIMKKYSSNSSLMLYSRSSLAPRRNWICIDSQSHSIQIISFA